MKKLVLLFVFMLFFNSNAFAVEDGKVVRIETLETKIENLEKQVEDGGFYKDALQFVETTENHFLGILSLIGFIFLLISFFGWKALQDVAANIAEKAAGAKLSQLSQRIEKQNATVMGLSFFMKALDVDPKAVNRKDSKLALNLYQLSLNFNPENSDAWNNIGSLLIDFKEYNKAIEHIKKSIELNPNNANGYGNWSAALIYKGNYKEALQLAEKALIIDPQNASAYYNKACANILLGNKKIGLEDLEFAISLDSNLKKQAREDLDFTSIRGDAEFKRITNENKK